MNSATLAKIIQGDSKAVEVALRAMLMCSWEGPIVRFMEEDKQNQVIRNENIFKDFNLNKREWVDPNTQVLVIKGDENGFTAAANQVHYKSLRGLNQKEYSDDFGDKSYVEAVLGARRIEKVDNKNEDQDWKIVENRRTFNEKNELFLLTVFMARLPEKVTSRQVWEWVIR